MHTDILVDVNGLTFVADTTLDDDVPTDNYYINEIYPNTPDWPFKPGLYDYLNEFTLVAIHAEVFDRLREIRSMRSGGDHGR